MKLDIRHRYDCTPARFWEMYWDDDLDAMLREGSTIQRDVVEEREEGEVLIRRLRFTPQQELPSVAAGILGTNKLVYEQENRFDRGAGVLHWSVMPTILPGKLDARGTVEVSAVGESACEQRVLGDIAVRIPLVGGRVEKAVVAEVEKSWNRTAEACREWLKKHGSTSA